MTNWRWVRAGMAACGLIGMGVVAIGSPPSIPGGGTRGPLGMAFSRDGRLAYVAEFDAGDVAVIDVASGKVAGHIASGGTEPTALALLPDDRTLLVVNSFSGSLAFIDLGTRRPTTALPLRGVPYDVVVSPDGERAYVSISQLDQVAVINVDRRREQARIPVGHRPRALAITPNGRRLACANLGSGDISVIDANLLTEERRLRTKGFNLRGVALVRSADVGLPGDGELAVVSCQVPNPAGQAAQIENGQIWSNFVEALPLDGGSQADGRPAQNVIGETWLDIGQPVAGPGPAFSASGGTALFENSGDAPRTQVLTRVLRPAEFHAAADPYDVVLLPNLNAGFVANGGVRAVTRFTLVQAVTRGSFGWQGGFGGAGGWGGSGLQRGSGAGFGGGPVSGLVLGEGFGVGSAGGQWVGAQPPLRQEVGLNPRSLALTPNREHLWVANHLGNSITVVNPRTLQVERTIDLGSPARPQPEFAGRVLFNDGFAAKEQWLSCNSCHPDGTMDGRSWKFVHVPDGFTDFRNTRYLRGGIQQTAPFRWSGHEATLEEFAQDEVTGLLKGPGRPETELKSLGAYLAGLRMPQNPYRKPDGWLTAAGIAGRSLFLGKGGCSACHGGPMSGGTGRKAWIGTTPEDRPLDVPHLVGAYDSAPYLHDGRAATLRDIFRQHNPLARHGHADQLTDPELDQLLEYVREL